MATNIVPIESTNLSSMEETISAGSTGTEATISAGNGEWIEVIEVQVKVTFDSAPSDNGDTVDLYCARSADDGTTVDQDDGSKDVGQNYVGSICDDSDEETNTYIKTIPVHIGRHGTLLIANHTDVDIVVDSVYYEGVKVVNS